MTLRIPLAVVGLLVAVPIAAAQQFLATPAGAAVDPNARFDVVVVKAVEAGHLQLCGPLADLFRLAYLDREIPALPDAVPPHLRDRYELIARATPGTPAAEMTGPLLRAFLEERFGVAAGQASSAGAAFEVVSIKENRSGDPSGGGDPMVLRIDPGGRLTGRNVSLRNLLLLAYRGEITRSQLGPLEPWMDRRRFNVDALAADGEVRSIDRQSAAVMDRMVQAMLADRFKLRVRRESRPGDVYALSVAPGGITATVSRNAEVCAGGADSRRVSPLANGMLPCHLFTRVGRRGFEAVAIDTSDLASVLREVLNVPVEDQARRDALFDASVHWNSDPLRNASRDAAGPEPQPADDDPDVATALREQLGLKLERRRGSVVMLIVESAEAPGE